MSNLYGKVVEISDLRFALVKLQRKIREEQVELVKLVLDEDRLDLLSVNTRKILSEHNRRLRDK